MWKLRPFITEPLAKYLYTTLIDPLFTYCDFIYDGSSNEIARKLQIAQNGALRAIKNCKIEYQTAKLHDELEIDYLSDTHKKSTLKMVYRGVHNEGPSKLNNMFEIYMPNRHLRSESQYLLLPPKMRTKFGEHNIDVRGCVYWNEISLDKRQITSLDSFKSQLKGYKTI